MVGRAVALEICLDAPDALAVVAATAADRVELCSALDLGGLTPGPGLIAAAARSGIDCHAMIRPRGGDFVLDGADLDACLDDIAAVRRAGLAGVVIGAACEDGTLNRPALARMIDAAGPLPVTLHRVFDLAPDRDAALETAVDLGVRRILTSGGAATAPDGRAEIARLALAAAGRVEIMAGGGVTPAAARPLIEGGVDALHASCATRRAGRQAVDRIGLDRTQRHADAGAIRALKQAMDQVETVQ